MTTLLLPALLVAPVERDIRIINVVNPFYAAATALPFNPSFSVVDATATSKNMSIISQEGQRSLRAIVLTRHLQRVLDALPSAAQVPKTEEGSRAVPVVSPKLQKSNIVAVSVSPGIGRVDTVSSILNADFMSSTGPYTGLAMFVASLCHSKYKLIDFYETDTFYFNHYCVSSLNLRFPECRLFYTPYSCQHLSRSFSKLQSRLQNPRTKTPKAPLISRHYPCQERCFYQAHSTRNVQP